ncbi:MAG: M15 family metallopeptidase [Patescibacteria group bacterium]
MDLLRKITDKDILKCALPVCIVIFFTMLIIYSSLLATEQKKRNELIKQEQLRKDAEMKVYLMGKFDPSTREDFVVVPEKYSLYNNGKMYLRKETLNAYLKMQEAAQREGVQIKISSATRNFEYQREFWNGKWSTNTEIDAIEKNTENFNRFKKILEYVSVPGTSRHHWGTEIDINGANLAYFNSIKGIREYQWLAKNAGTFGFCQTYRNKDIDKRTGYNEERWHWSYTPLSKTFTEEYRRLVTKEDIYGFIGDKYVLEQDLVNQYALSINPECL